jgi:hypothetical protein
MPDGKPPYGIDAMLAATWKPFSTLYSQPDTGWKPEPFPHAAALVEGVEELRQKLLRKYGVDPAAHQDTPRDTTFHTTSTQNGCHRHETGTWIHGRPHTCPVWLRNRSGHA